MNRRPPRRWPALGAVILVGALLQALTVLPRSTPGWSVTFGLLFLGSYLVLVASTALLAAAVTDKASPTPLPRPSRRLWVAAALAPWVLVAAGFLGAPAVPVAVPIVAVLVVTAGERAAVGGWHRAPVLLLATVGTILVAALGWVLALVLGLFVTGFVGALSTWIAFGILGVGVLRWWSGLLRGPAVHESDEPVATVTA